MSHKKHIDMEAISPTVKEENVLDFTKDFDFNRVGTFVSRWIVPSEKEVPSEMIIYPRIIHDEAYLSLAYAPNIKTQLFKVDEKDIHLL